MAGHFPGFRLLYPCNYAKIYNPLEETVENIRIVLIGSTPKFFVPQDLFHQGLPTLEFLTLSIDQPAEEILRFCEQSLRTNFLIVNLEERCDDSGIWEMVRKLGESKSHTIALLPQNPLLKTLADHLIMTGWLDYCRLLDPDLLAWQIADMIRDAEYKQVMGRAYALGSGIYASSIAIA
jgi:hypothetical protein